MTKLTEESVTSNQTERLQPIRIVLNRKRSIVSSSNCFSENLAADEREAKISKMEEENQNMEKETILENNIWIRLVEKVLHFEESKVKSLTEENSKLKKKNEEKNIKISTLFDEINVMEKEMASKEFNAKLSAEENSRLKAEVEEKDKKLCELLEKFDFLMNDSAKKIQNLNNLLTEQEIHKNNLLFRINKSELLEEIRRKEINSIHTKMKKMYDINMKAMDEYRRKYQMAVNQTNFYFCKLSQLKRDYQNLKNQIYLKNSVPPSSASIEIPAFQPYSIFNNDNKQLLMQYLMLQNIFKEHDLVGKEEEATNPATSPNELSSVHSEQDVNSTDTNTSFYIQNISR